MRALPVGLANTLVDLSVLNLLILTGAFEGTAGRAIANVAAFGAGATNSYYWNDRFVFRTSHGWEPRRLLSFLGVSVAGLLTNTAVFLFLAAQLSHVLPSTLLALNAAKVAAAGLSFSSTYLLYRSVVFRTVPGVVQPRSLGLRRPRLQSAWSGRPATIGAVLLIAAVALAVRLPLISFKSGDYNHFLSPWYDYIRAHGYLSAMGDGFTNYSPPYIYLLGAAAYAPLAKLAAIKWLSITFDFGLATAVLLAVRQRYSNRWIGLGAFGATLFTPTVVLNGALWGQCDAFYTLFLILAVVFASRKKPALAMLMLGTALSIKLQAVFLVPLFVLLTLSGAVRLRHWLILPSTYLVAIAPAWLLGRSFTELLTTYSDQANHYKQLTIDAPTVYQWFPDAPVAYPGIAVAGLATAVVCMLAWRRGVSTDPGALVALSLAFVLLLPLLLPRMHERYFYPADVLSLLYAFYFPKRAFLPVIVVSVSVLSYWPSLFGAPPVPMPVLPVFLIMALGVVLRDLFGLPRYIASQLEGSLIAPYPVRASGETRG